MRGLAMSQFRFCPRLMVPIHTAQAFVAETSLIPTKSTKLDAVFQQSKASSGTFGKVGVTQRVRRPVARCCRNIPGRCCGGADAVVSSHRLTA